MSETTSHATETKAASAQWPLLLILAAVQFVHVLDFVIIMPLAPQLMRVFEIGPQSFGFLVSAYNLSAAVGGLVGAFLLDRFDRRPALLVILAGFTLGTLICGFSPSVGFLLMARSITGFFGGLIQALIFAIIGDCFPENQRGTATGTVMSAFSIASVIGIPIGLALADRFDWRMPFFFLGALALISLAFSFRILPAIRAHLHPTSQASAFAPGLRSVAKLAGEANSLRAFALIISLMFAGFMVIPFISAYLVSNVGLTENDLVTVFFAGGIATLISSRLVGIIADRFGKTRVFYWIAFLSTIPIYLLTHLPHTSVYAAVAVTTSFTVLISSRMIPAIALITSCIDRLRRGSFMSLTSSVQQASSGLASLVAGMILGLGPDGEITHYGTVGAIAIISTLFAIYFASRLKVR